MHAPGRSTVDGRSSSSTLTTPRSNLDLLVQLVRPRAVREKRNSNRGMGGRLRQIAVEKPADPLATSDTDGPEHSANASTQSERRGRTDVVPRCAGIGDTCRCSRSISLRRYWGVVLTGVLRASGANCRCGQSKPCCTPSPLLGDIVRVGTSRPPVGIEPSSSPVMDPCSASGWVPPLGDTTGRRQGWPEGR